MQIQISCHNMSMSDALRERVNTRLGDSVRPLIDSAATEMQVMLTQQDGVDAAESQLCRINVLIPHEGQVVVARASDDIYKAIDMVHDALVNQTKHLLSRHNDKHRMRKDAEKSRAHVARQNMTTFEDGDLDAQTKREVDAYEQSARP